MNPVRRMPLTRDTLSGIGLNPSMYPLVRPGDTWSARLRRWVWRKLWRLLKFSARKGWARRRILAPWTIGAAAWIIAAIGHLIDHGWMSILSIGTLGVLPMWWWLGLPAWKLTRRRNVKPTEQRIWYASYYAMMLAWTTVAASWRLGPPMPGILGAITLTAFVRWAWHHRVRHEPAPVIVTDPQDERVVRWERISATGKRLAEVELLNITEHEKPRRWTADLDLPSGDKTVEDVMNAQRNIASLFSARRDNVIIDSAPSGNEDAARLTVVLDNPCHEAIEYDETWIGETNGCVKFHTYPDGQIGSLRLWLPRSGGVNTFWSGDVRSGKSAGMEAALTQAVMTGKVWPMIGDPQGGQSLPTWCREDGEGAARSQAVDPAGVYRQLLAIRRAMYARSRLLARMEWEDEDGKHTGLSFFDTDLTGLPFLLYVLDEAHIACKDPEYGQMIVALLEEVIKMCGKTGIIVWLANQYPGIEELGNKMSIRQNLMAGNAVGYRNSAGHAAKSMILPSHMPSPFLIPQETPTGEHTKGTAVIQSAAPRSSRATYARSVWVKRSHYWATLAMERCPELDQVTAEALADVMVGYEAEVEPEAESAVPPAVVAAEPSAKEPGQVWPKIREFLQSRPGGWAHTGVIAHAINVPLPTVSTTLRRAAEKNRAHTVRRGTWALGPKSKAQHAQRTDSGKIAEAAA